MPVKPVKDYRRVGALRVPANVSGSGPADEVASLTSVDDVGIMHRLNNNGEIIHSVRGDGVHIVPVLSSTPLSLEPGMVWLRELAGTTYLYFTDHTGTVTQVPITAAPVVGPIALTDGVATTVDSIAVTTTMSWWLDIVDTNTAPESHVSCRIDAAVTDSTAIDWSIYGQTADFDHIINLTYGAGIATLEVTADGTGYEARARSTAL